MGTNTDALRTNTDALRTVFDGWDGYHLSLIHTVAPLSREQLAWRLTPDQRSVGELAEHIAFGRIDWFHRMDAPGSAELAAAAPPAGSLVEDAAQIVCWLEATWKMVEDTLTAWQVSDLTKTYRHNYWGQTYAVSRQWTIWRILAHDIHHGANSVSCWPRKESTCRNWEHWAGISPCRL